MSPVSSSMKQNMACALAIGWELFVHGISINHFSDTNWHFVNVWSTEMVSHLLIYGMHHACVHAV